MRYLSAIAAVVIGTMSVVSAQDQARTREVVLNEKKEHNKVYSGLRYRDLNKMIREYCLKEVAYVDAKKVENDTFDAKAAFVFDEVGKTTDGKPLVDTLNDLIAKKEGGDNTVNKQMHEARRAVDSFAREAKITSLKNEEYKAVFQANLQAREAVFEAALEILRQVAEEDAIQFVMDLEEATAKRDALDQELKNIK